MDKSNFLTGKSSTRQLIALICLVGMVAGFIFSRVGLSFFTFAFGVNAIWKLPPREWLKDKWWLLGMVWISYYAITWFWCADKHNWSDRIQVKLAIMLLPLAFTFMPALKEKQWQIFTISTGILLCISAIYSMSFLFYDKAHLIWLYKVGDVLPTLPKFDHIRCSLMMALYVAWGIYSFPKCKTLAEKWGLGAILVLITIYIHVLAAKSGLIALYLFVVSYGFYFMISKRKLVYGMAIIMIIPLFYYLAINYLPTFKQRKDYIYFSMVDMAHDKTGKYGDIGRLNSYDIAIRLIRQRPWTGVGTGDILTAMKTGYDRWYPLVPDSSRLYPHNQFLTVALGCGLPAMLLFLWWVIAPLALLKRNRESFFFFITWFILFIQLMIEPMLEVQFGVFVYLFFLLIFRQVLILEGQQRPNQKINTDE